ncbi:hypothetical protein FQZ97_1021580 [compost metagenome]
MGNHRPGFRVIQQHLLEPAVFVIVQVVFALPFKGRQFNEECVHASVRYLRIVSVALALCVKRGANQFEGCSVDRPDESGFTERRF